MSTKTMLMHSAHQEQFDAPGRDLVFFDKPVDAARLSRITDVHLWAPPGSTIEQLPEIVAAMPNLTRLSIGPGEVSPAIITQLRHGDLPESLAELFVGTGERALAWPDVAVPNLTTLYVEGPFRFTPECFPRLRNLSITPQRSLNNVRQALTLPLEELNLLRVPIDEEIFRILEPVGLRRLGLLGGRTLQSLAGIGALPQLESLRLKNLTALGDISELSALQRLEILNIQYCKQLTGITAISGLQALRRLTIVGCGSIGLGAIEQKLSTLEWVNTGATT